MEGAKSIVFSPTTSENDKRLKQPNRRMDIGECPPKMQSSCPCHALMYGGTTNMYGSIHGGNYLMTRKLHVQK